MIAHQVVWQNKLEQSPLVMPKLRTVTYDWCKKTTEDHYTSYEGETCGIVDL